MQIWSFVATLAVILATSSFTRAQTCQTSLTYGYGYDKFYAVEEPNTGFQFYVRVQTAAYARIYLLKDNSTAYPYIVITLGDDSNKISTIRDQTGKILDQQPPCGLLSDHDMIGDFRITYIGHRVAVFAPGSSTPFLSATVVIDINSVAFSSDYFADWRYLPSTSVVPISFQTQKTYIYYQLLPGGGGINGTGTSVSFAVKAPSDIIVLFSHVEFPLKSDPVYEILIDNTLDGVESPFTTIHGYQEGADLYTVRTPFHVNDTVFNCFRAEVTVDTDQKAVVKVYHDGPYGETPTSIPYFRWKDEQGHLPIGFYSVSSNFDFDAVWEFPCSCAGKPRP